MSKTLRLRLPVVVLIVAAVGFSAGGAPASPPATVSGSYVYTDSWFESFRSAGGNAIIELSATVEYTGTFTGTSTVHGVLVAHADGRATFHDVEVFTGTVNGVPGTVTWRLGAGCSLTRPPGGMQVSDERRPGGRAHTQGESGCLEITMSLRHSP